jgi:GTP cyclohydrolase II
MTILPKLTHAATANLPTKFGDFTLHIFTDTMQHEHMAMVAGTPTDNCLVRVHSECATGDIMGSLRCDCRDQLETALGMIAAAGHGVVLYLRGHEGRGIGLANKIKAYALQERGLDTVAANLRLGFAPDVRDYTVAAAMLQLLGVQKLQLLTNNPTKINALTAAGLTITARVPLWLADNPHNKDYLQSKRDKMQHL